MADGTRVPHTSLRQASQLDADVETDQLDLRNPDETLRMAFELLSNSFSLSFSVAQDRILDSESSSRDLQRVETTK